MSAVMRFDPAAPVVPTVSNKPDLVTEAAIDTLVMKFYYKLLNDPVMAPLFYDVAKIHVASHIRNITLYWYKILLSDKRYQRNTMQVHRNLHLKQPLRGIHHELWLRYFMATVDENFAGPNADKAKRTAMRFISNLYWQTNCLDALPKTRTA